MRRLRGSSFGGRQRVSCAGIVLYVDACAVVKRYVDEDDTDTAALNSVFTDAERWGGLVSSEWLILEVASALARKMRTSKMSAADFQRVMKKWRLDSQAVNLIAIESEHLRAAAALLETVPPVERFHAGDAIHLYTALQIKSDIGGADRLVLVTTDHGFKSTATVHGLDVHDPSADDVERLSEFFRN